MYQTTETKSVIYNYKVDGRTCSTPNVEIAIKRRDEDSTIQVETIINGVSEMSTLVLD